MIIFILNSLIYPYLLAASRALTLCISGLTAGSLTTHISNPLFLLTLNFLTTAAHLKLCLKVSLTRQNPYQHIDPHHDHHAHHHRYQRQLPYLLLIQLEICAYVNTK